MYAGNTSNVAVSVQGGHGILFVGAKIEEKHLIETVTDKMEYSNYTTVCNLVSNSV